MYLLCFQIGIITKEWKRKQILMIYFVYYFYMNSVLNSFSLLTVKFNDMCSTGIFGW